MEAATSVRRRLCKRERTRGPYRTVRHPVWRAQLRIRPSGLYGEVARANLISVETRLELEPTSRTDAYLAVRPLWLADATGSFGQTGVRDATGASGREVGTQVEARARWWAIPKRVRMAAGGVYLATGRFLRDAPNASTTGDTRYAYAEITYSF